MTDPISLRRSGAARQLHDGAGEDRAQAVQRANQQFRALLLKELIKPLSQALGPQSGGWGGDSGSMGAGFGAGGTAANVYGFFWEEALAGQLEDAWPLPNAIDAPGAEPATGELPLRGLGNASATQLLQRRVQGVVEALALDRDAVTLPYTLQVAAESARANATVSPGKSAVPPAANSSQPVASTSPPTTSRLATEEIRRLSERAGRIFDLPGPLIEAVIATESSGDSTAVSPKGAQGLMQLMPGTADEMGIRDSLDPWQNVYAGTKYLRQQLDRFGDLSLALAAYNAGPGTVTRHGGIPPYKETQAYVTRVLDHVDRLAEK